VTARPDHSPKPLRVLVLGGTRSGKSAYAESVAQSCSSSLERGRVRYVATGRRDPNDADWQDRIDAHRRRRPHAWETTEIFESLPATLSAGADVTIVDDLGTWLTGIIDDRDAWTLPRGTVVPEGDALVDAVVRCTGTVLLVSPEVGWGVIPSTRSGRLFQDEMGSLNGRLAAVCDRVVLVVAGLPLMLKDTREQAGPTR